MAIPSNAAATMEPHALLTSRWRWAEKSGRTLPIQSHKQMKRLFAGLFNQLAR